MILIASRHGLWRAIEITDDDEEKDRPAGLIRKRDTAGGQLLFIQLFFLLAAVVFMWAAKIM